MSQIDKYLKKGLNEIQYKAAKRYETSSLILAGAGSGKTRVLTYKIANLIFDQGIKPHNILAVTFTNKAANEMKQRLLEISENLGNNQNNSNIDDFDTLLNNTNQAKQNFKLSSFDLKRVGTFHSIFLKILKEDIEGLEKGYNKNFGVYDENESISVIKEVLNETKLANQIPHLEAKRSISNLKNKGITPSKYLHLLQTDKEEYIAKVYEKYQKKLEQSNMLDFDDLLLIPNILFNQNPQILEKRQNKFKYILVDEAQDTNQLQFDLIKQLCGKQGNVTFIGDDYQSIYGWRGAVMDNFLNISKRWPNVEIFKLEINYRSRPHIVQAGNHIISKNTKQYSKNVTSNRTGNDKIRLFCFSDETDEALSTIDIIKKMKEEKNVDRGKFAILYRTNAQSQPYEQVLLTQGIPYKIWGGFKFFERQEIKDVISYIKYIINPKDSVALKRIINTPNRKIGKTSVEKMEELANEQGIGLNEILDNIDRIPIKLMSSAQNSIKQFNISLKIIINQINNLTPAELINNIISSIKYKEYLVTSDGPEKAQERMENIGQLINMATKYEDKGIEIIRQFLEEITLMTDLEENSEGNIDAVQLMTVHASKGLEFPVVFIGGLEENMFPLSKAKFDQNELEEERRLMYVAMTRARDILFLSYANCRQQRGQTKYNEESRFLEELPDELITKYDLGTKSSNKKQSDLDEGDIVKHKLFGKGTVLEVWNEVTVVRFWNEKYGIRRIDNRFLEKE